MQQVLLPTLRRRLVLLSVTGLIGAALGYLLPDLAAWANGIVLVGVLALMAGISGLWSP